METTNKKLKVEIEQCYSIEVDNNDIKSIKRAEKLKKMLENKGYNLKSNITIGFDKFLMVYSKLF